MQMDYFEQENSRRPSPLAHAILNTQINSAYIPQCHASVFVYVVVYNFILDLNFIFLCF